MVLEDGEEVVEDGKEVEENGEEVEEDGEEVDAIFCRKKNEDEDEKSIGICW